MTSLLVELQTEELPPKALKKLSEAFAQGVASHLKAAHFTTEESVVRPFGAPRRMAVLITDVLAKSPDEAFRQKLVPVKVGIGADGQATPALVKKMASLGIDCPVEALKRESDGKNEQLFYEGVRAGVELAAGLQKALEAFGEGPADSEGQALPARRRRDDCSVRPPREAPHGALRRRDRSRHDVRP